MRVLLPQMHFLFLSLVLIAIVVVVVVVVTVIVIVLVAKLVLKSGPGLVNTNRGP